MKLRKRVLTMAGLALLGSLALAACARPPQPCDTDVAEVEAARARAAAAHRELLAKAEGEKADLEKQVAELQSQLRSEADYQALLEKLEDLKCGSGR